MEFKAIHLTTGHSRPPVSCARLPTRPPIRPSTQSTRSFNHPTDRCRILSALMARSQKAFHTIHLTQAMWYPLPCQTACSGTAGRPPFSNPLTRLLTCRPCGLQIIAYFVGVSFSDWLGYDIIRATFDYILRALSSAKAFRFSSRENVYYNAEDV